MPPKAAKKAAKKSGKTKKQRREEEEEIESTDLEETEEEEQDEEEESEEEETEAENDEESKPPKAKGKKAKVRKGDDDLEESALSIEARRSRREPEDIQRFKKRKTREVALIAVQMGFDGLKRIRPGVKFIYKAPLDDDGKVILPTWARLEKDYVPDPDVELPPGMRPRVRGGASQGGVKPNL